MRLDGFRWRVIAERYFRLYAHPASTARSCAKKYARDAGRPWPIILLPGLGTADEKRMIAAKLHSRGVSWLAIGKHLWPHVARPGERAQKEVKELAIRRRKTGKFLHYDPAPGDHHAD